MAAAYATPEELAHAMSDQADHGYLVDLVRALFESAPGVRERILDDATDELKEEMLRDDTPDARTAVEVMDAALRRIEDAS